MKNDIITLIFILVIIIIGCIAIILGNIVSPYFLLIGLINYILIPIHLWVITYER